MFGQGNKPPVPGVFGQAPTPTSTTGESGFGRIDALFSSSNQPPASNPFGSQTQAFPKSTPVFGGSMTSTVPSGNLFGAAGTSVAPSGPFGATTQAPSVFGGASTKAVFGGFGNPAGASNVGSSVKPDQNLFGKGPAATGLPFGKPVTSSASSSVPSKPETTNLFKAAVADAKSSKDLFGKKGAIAGSSPNPLAAGTFKPVFGGASSTAGLFGKPAEPKGAVAKEAAPFGKSLTEAAESFLKKPEMLSNPFSAKPSQVPKPGIVKKTQDSPKLFGKSIASHGQSSGATAEPESSGQFRPKLRRDTEATARPERSKAASGLFGKALTDATSGSKGRQPVAKRVMSEEVEDQTALAKERKRRIRDDSKDERQQRERPKTIIRTSAAFSSEPVALVVKNIPASCNNKATLTRHFSKFGDVKQVFSNPSKSSADVHFASHEGALQAKKSGRKIKENLPAMQLFWSSYTPGKGGADADDSSQDDSKPKPGSIKAVLRKSIDSRLRRRNEGGRGDEERRGKETTDRSRVQRSQGRSGTPEAQSSTAATARDTTRARSASPVRIRGPASPASPSRRGRGTPPPGRTTGGVVSLKALGDSVAQSANDFFTILDNRDKLIREAMDLKNRDWAKAAAMKGTCPDMCPERERYMREDRHQLSIYEAIPGTESVDHYRAVKEYSRSSADQDMPLPHELRPAETLDRTMIYLLNNIVDQGRDGLWADWYDFLWNRTRAIRKDITQQHLCDLTTVGLIEKCVRFHIYSAHTLCEEPMMCFDVKINNENLTKCLQTLKELYHDLNVKHNTPCPHEAEFRAYMVLMNLNEGDALREAQQLPPAIRQSPEMVFALKAHSALNENNYVKFFKLALQSSFLQGCIIHRYFNQLRKKAIMVLLRAYAAAGAVAYPLEKIASLLKFENLEETQSFLTHHGLVVREGSALLERGAFVDPEAVFPTKRAEQLIGSKLRTTVGEAINGEPLPPNDILEPTNSFDSSGRFMVSSVPLPRDELEAVSPAPAAPRQSAPVAPPVSVVPAVIPTDPRVAPPVVVSSWVPPSGVASIPMIKAGDLPYDNEVVKDIAKELFLEVITEMCQDIGVRFVRECNMAARALLVQNSIVQEVMQEMAKQTILEVVDEIERAKKEAELRKKAILAAERQASIERASNELIEDIVQSAVGSLFEDIAQEEYRIVQQDLEKQSEARMSIVVCDEVFKQGVEAEIKDTAKDFYQEHVVRRLQQLKQAEEAVRLAFVGRFFHLWKNETAGRKRLKRVFLTFPAAPNMDPMPQQIQDLVPESAGVVGDKVNLGGSVNLTLQSPTELVQDRGRIRRSCSAHNLYAKLRHRLAWSPINVGEVILDKMRTETVPSRQRDGSCYWKGVLTLPDELSVPEEYPKWLRAKFTKGGVPMDIPSDNKSELLSLYSVRNTVNTANVCVRCVNGDLPSRTLERYCDRRDFNAASALLHLIYCPPDMSKNVDFWRHEEQRLDKLLRVMPRGGVPILVLLCHDKCNSRLIPEIEMRLGLRHVSRESVKLLELQFDVDDPVNQLKLQEGLEWLIQHSPALPNLTFSPLMDVVDSMVTLEFSQQVYQDLASRRKRGHLDHPLEILVAFYNDVIEYLAECVSDPQLQDFSWPPPEFATKHTETLPEADWNSADSLLDCKDTILNMRLPEPDLISADTWEDGCNLVWSFLEAVVEDSIQSSHVELYSRVRWLLRRAQDEMADLCDFLLEDSEKEDKFLSANLPWTEIVMACVRQKLNEVKFNPTVSEQENGLPKTVGYENKKLGQYQPLELWSSAIRSGVLEEDETLEMSVLKSLKRKQEWSEDAPVKSLKVNDQPMLDIAPLRPVEMEANRTLTDLEISVAAGKEESKALDDMLRNALNPENMSNNNCNGSYSNSFIQSQMPMYAVSPGEFNDLVNDSTDTSHRRSSLSDELTDFRAKMQSYKKAQLLETLRLERMLMEY